MSELTWILDPTTGQLVVEGLTAEEASALAGDLLPPARAVTCTSRPDDRGAAVRDDLGANRRQHT